MSVPIDPGKGRHATLTAIAAAEEQHEGPILQRHILDAAVDLGILDDYEVSSVRRRVSTLFDQGLVDRQETESGYYVYSVTDAGAAELDEHGAY